MELLAGWGLAAALLVPLQWLAAPDLRGYAVVLAAAAVGAALARRRALLRNDLWRPALLLLPALVVACGVPLDEWDSFSHWGINAAWLWRFDALPAPGMPVSPSSNPDYPYGYPLALYLASLARGAYIENAGAIVNLLTLVGVASGLALFAAGGDRDRLDARPWYWSAWGVLAVMALNPGFVRSTTLATYADTAFAAALLFLCVAAWRLGEDDGGRRTWTAATCAAALALVSVKEGGLLLLGVVAIALLLLGVRWPAWRGRLPWTMAALLPALLVALAWQAWVAGWLPSSFAVLPWAEWRFDLLPELLAAAGAVVVDHLLYYLLLVAVVVLGARGAWRRRDAADRFHALAGLVILGHFTTMLLAYLGASFTGEEVARAASFHRYAAQLAPLALDASRHRHPAAPPGLRAAATRPGGGRLRAGHAGGRAISAPGPVGAGEFLPGRRARRGRGIAARSPGGAHRLARRALRLFPAALCVVPAGSRGPRHPPGTPVPAACRGR